MKKDRIIYWAATGIVTAVMLVSAMEFGLDPAMKGAFAHLGLPDWFRIELTVAKILGALALLIPGVPTGIKAFAYAGFTITLVSAVIAHLSSGDGARSLDPAIFLCLLTVSFYYFRRGRSGSSRMATGR